MLGLSQLKPNVFLTGPFFLEYLVIFWFGAFVSIWVLWFIRCGLWHRGLWVVREKMKVSVIVSFSYWHLSLLVAVAVVKQIGSSTWLSLVFSSQSLRQGLPGDWITGVCARFGPPTRLWAFSCFGHWRSFLPSIPSFVPLRTDPEARPGQADHSMLWTSALVTHLEPRLWWLPAKLCPLLLLDVACSHHVSQSCHIHFLVCVGELFTSLATGWHLWFYFKSFFFFLIVLCRSCAGNPSCCEFTCANIISCSLTHLIATLLIWLSHIMLFLS